MLRALLLSPLVVVIAAGVAVAQPPAVPTISTIPATPTISEAELLARLATDDPRSERIAAEVDAATADERAAGARPNPTLSLDREEVFPDGGIATNYVRAALPLQLSGQRGRRVAAARATTRAVAAEGSGARFALTVDALRRFRTAAYERARLALLRAERAALVKAVEVVRKRTSAGAASGYDLQRIELELAVYDDQLLAAESELVRARGALGMLVGLPAVDAAGALDLPGEPPGLEALLGTALDARADHRAATLRLEAAGELRRAAGRAWIPDLTLSGGWMSQDVEGGALAHGYTAGVALSVPLLDHGQADRARASAIRRAAEADRKVLAREVPATIRTRHHTLLQTVARARAVRTDQLARLEQLLRSAETGYREGGGNVVELLDAYTTARDTRLRELELRRDASLAELDLWLTLGRRP